MRVIAGVARGRRLRAPRGVGVRPTADRVKESIFNLLGTAWHPGAVLDLFAGTGSLGIEALSRGASAAFFVEADPRCLAVLLRNVEACGFQDRAHVVRADVLRFLAGPAAHQRFELILADPPYDRGLAWGCVAGVARGRWLAPQGRLVLEHSKREEPAPEIHGLARCDLRAYGDTRISIYEPTA
jgi:16S rRNA (guanine(966)-N(2))-methyltransferase RsmD